MWFHCKRVKTNHLNHMKSDICVSLYLGKKSDQGMRTTTLCSRLRIEHTMFHSCKWHKGKACSPKVGGGSSSTIWLPLKWSLWPNPSDYIYQYNCACPARRLAVCYSSSPFYTMFYNNVLTIFTLSSWGEREGGATPITPPLTLLSHASPISHKLARFSEGREKTSIISIFTKYK